MGYTFGAILSTDGQILSLGENDIRNCVLSKSFQICADCDKLDNCALLVNIHQYLPEA
jgi:deoxycytidylate deaminase